MDEFMSQGKNELEKIDVLYANFKDLGIFVGCVGSQKQIQRLQAYLHFQKESKNTPYLVEFIKRALSNQIYCYVGGHGLKGKLISGLINKKLAKTGNKINEARWNEALILVHPERISMITGISKEEIKEMQKQTKWEGLFAYDEYII